MPPIRGKKRKSVESNEDENTQDITMGQKVPTKSGSSSVSQESPHKKRKTGITIAQKQALIDNLQLEITERARKLRANYNIHAQSLRTRIEIRVNRIPLSLRRAKMGDLLQKYSVEGQQKAGANSMRGPPVPEKDIHTTLSRYPLQRTAHMLAMGSPAHMIKRGSRDISGGDKENEIDHIESPKKARLGPAAEIARNPAQVLSPASSNSRIAPRGAAASTATANVSPVKSGIARPVSPVKPSNIISNMVEKARATRGGTTAAAPASKRGRANTTSTITSSSSSERSGGTSRAARTKGTAASQQPARPATRTAPRVSGISESSDGSTSTVVRKRPGTAMSTKSAPGGTSFAPAKRNVISTIKKGVAASTSRKATTTTKVAATPASTTSTGRVLRKRA